MIGTLRAAVRNKKILVGGLFLLLLVLFALFSQVISPYDPEKVVPGQFLKSPNSTFWFGTDQLGRDLFARLGRGARITIIVSLSAIALSGIVGTLAGAASGYAGGWTATIVMRVVDMILTVPSLLLAIITAAFWGRDIPHLVVILAIVNVPQFARIAYGSALALRDVEFVQASRAIGASSMRILRLALLPNMLAPIIIMTSLRLAFVIQTEAALSFLGLGPPPPATTWGRLISQSTAYMHVAPHLILVPSIAIGLTIIALNMFGDGLRDVLDPRLRGSGRAR